jgi:CubicO group peptidase (beta-lactamase class C family)
VIEGACDDRFAPVRDVFAELVASGVETGAGLAVIVDGRPVVDLWGGTAHPGVPWTRDTIVHTYSVTKPFAAVCLLLLVQRGAVDLDAPVTRYWPEYGAAGKEATTVRHLLSHRAGVVAWSRPQPLEALLDWDRATALCAAQEPAWPPGSAQGEHVRLYGHLVGEVVRRVDGRRPGVFLRAEVSGPLGLDFAVGLTPAEEARCATVTGLDDAFRDRLLTGATPLFRAAAANPPGLTDPAVVNGAAWRGAEVPAVNGHGTARAVAGLYAHLLGHGPGSGRLLARETVAEAVRPQGSGADLVLGRDVTWGLGVQLSPDGSYGMGGLGGATGYADPARGCAFGYVTRRMADHARADRLEQAVNACLDRA